MHQERRYVHQKIKSDNFLNENKQLPIMQPPIIIFLIVCGLGTPKIKSFNVVKM